HAGFYIFRCNDEISPALIRTAHNDMGVGMTSIMVIDRDPVETGAKIMFHAIHKSPRGLSQVAEGLTVFRGNNDTELVAIMFAPFQEPFRFRCLALSGIEVSALPAAFNTVALDIV
ncbi:MAG TPA: hypothetical protein DEB52_20310, partial [Hyphomonas sp.]|nr:hypothetical protein [Hyphomonas sp.]